MQRPGGERENMANSETLVCSVLLEGPVEGKGVGQTRLKMGVGPGLAGP